jgi:hypothetical protein
LHEKAVAVGLMEATIEFLNPPPPRRKFLGLF